MRLDSTALDSTAAGYQRSLVRRHPRLAWTASGQSRHVEVERRMVLGAAEGVDLVLDDPSISGLHAELDPQESGLWVRDLGSRNGTFVNGVRVLAAAVPEGGTLRVGGTEILVSYAPEPSEVPLWDEPTFGPLVGPSAVMRALFARLSRIASSEATVLIEGESGTGKELVARAIHEKSARAGGPLVIVDCGALPEALLEAELFGHAKGAFTGAAEARAGAIESGDGGTVFLDEIGELPLAMQPKLLRAVEGRAVRRLGETKYRPVDVRFLSATNRDLRMMVNAEAFRQDLYFRLAVLPVRVPPLRERREDIPVLARHLLPASAHALLTPELLRDLVSRPWLGNVRELRNALERLTILGPRDALPSAEPVANPFGSVATALTDLPFKDFRARCWEELERTYVARLLETSGRHVTAAAERAGLARTYLHRLIKRYDL
jgi:DNA-binding NtrC family response regulator